MKIILRINDKDNDRVEVWKSGMILAVIHVDDIFGLSEDKPMKDSLYGKSEREYNLEEITDG